VRNRYRIAHRYAAISKNPQVDAPKISGPKVRPRNEAQGICTKARTKFLTTIVRPTRYLQNRAANLDLTSDRQILARKIQISKQLIPEQPQGLTVSNELGNWKFHHSDLGVDTTFRVSDPFVAHQAAINAQTPSRDDFAQPTVTPTHQEIHRAEIFWQSGHLNQTGL